MLIPALQHKYPYIISLPNAQVFLFPSFRGVPEGRGVFRGIKFAEYADIPAVAVGDYTPSASLPPLYERGIAKLNAFFIFTGQQCQKALRLPIL
jgi:hypothetical protein